MAADKGHLLSERTAMVSHKSYQLMSTVEIEKRIQPMDSIVPEWLASLWSTIGAQTYVHE